MQTVRRPRLVHSQSIPQFPLQGLLFHKLHKLSPSRKEFHSQRSSHRVCHPLQSLLQDCQVRFQELSLCRSRYPRGATSTASMAVTDSPRSNQPSAKSHTIHFLSKLHPLQVNTMDIQPSRVRPLKLVPRLLQASTLNITPLISNVTLTKITMVASTASSRLDRPIRRLQLLSVRSAATMPQPPSPLLHSLSLPRRPLSPDMLLPERLKPAVTQLQTHQPSPSRLPLSLARVSSRTQPSHKASSQVADSSTHTATHTIPAHITLLT